MNKIYKLGYRNKGTKTWHPITINLNLKALKSVTSRYKSIPKSQLPRYNIPTKAIFIKKEVKRFRK